MSAESLSTQYDNVNNTDVQSKSVSDMKSDSLSTNKNFRIVIGVSIAVVVAVSGYFIWKKFKKS